MSSSQPIIEVNGISKAYKISHQLQRNSNPTIRDDVMMALRKPLGWIGASGGVDKETIWALKDVNFTVDKGEVVGIMGRNGSGKSTLFKVLSRITHPTEGNAILRGKTGSLLEVGTGFHPELTGRENVYFNGAVLGMKKKEIDQKFDQIVAFSEVERFLDTPVKFYSSGMKVRLAFSVAAFLNPEILIIDEVLAVGDVRFKKKSLDHMKKLADEDGRTILFVSHIISKIEKICTRGVVLDEGQLVLDGELDDAIDKYLELNDTEEDVGDDSTGVMGGRDSYFSGLLNYKILKTEVTIGNDGLPSLTLNFDITNDKASSYDDLELVFMITDPTGKNVGVIKTETSHKRIKIDKTDKKRTVELKINGLNLVPDKYGFNMTLRDRGQSDMVYFKSFNAGDFTIPDYEAFGLSFKKKRGGQPPVALFYDLK